ncbi:hypothetical protein VB636_00380, partial [Paracoccus sp. APAP_BH8]
MQDTARKGQQMGENNEFPTPVVEKGGTTAGRKKIFQGVGENTIHKAKSTPPKKDSHIQAIKAPRENQ